MILDTRNPQVLNSLNSCSKMTIEAYRIRPVSVSEESAMNLVMPEGLDPDSARIFQQMSEVAVSLAERFDSDEKIALTALINVGFKDGITEERWGESFIGIGSSYTFQRAIARLKDTIPGLTSKLTDTDLGIQIDSESSPGQAIYKPFLITNIQSGNHANGSLPASNHLGGHPKENDGDNRLAIRAAIRKLALSDSERILANRIPEAADFAQDKSVIAKQMFPNIDSPVLESEMLTLRLNSLSSKLESVGVKIRTYSIDRKAFLFLDVGQESGDSAITLEELSLPESFEFNFTNGDYKQEDAIKVEIDKIPKNIEKGSKADDTKRRSMRRGNFPEQRVIEASFKNLGNEAVALVVPRMVDVCVNDEAVSYLPQDINEIMQYLAVDRNHVGELARAVGKESVGEIIFKSFMESLQDFLSPKFFFN